MDTWRRIIYFLLDILKYNIVIVDPDKTDVKQVDDTTCIVLSSLHNLSSSFTLSSLLNNNNTQNRRPFLRLLFNNASRNCRDFSSYLGIVGFEQRLEGDNLLPCSALLVTNHVKYGHVTPPPSRGTCTIRVAAAYPQ